MVTFIFVYESYVHYQRYKNNAHYDRSCRFKVEKEKDNYPEVSISYLGFKGEKVKHHYL